MKKKKAKIDEQPKDEQSQEEKVTKKGKKVQERDKPDLVIVADTTKSETIDKEEQTTVVPESSAETPAPKRLSKKVYEAELTRLQLELVKMQYWIKQEGLRLLILFEGRDAAGKGGMIKRITEPLNPRGCRVVALPKPNEEERTQWYFQRYLAHLPSGGEIALFDRSWYNRAGVEYVMGYCSAEEHEEFLRSCPDLEQMLIRSGIILLKYWFSVSDEEQERRFQERANNPAKRWKLSPMDLESRRRWVEYSRAKDTMFKFTDTKHSPWYVVESDDKRRAHLNCLSHILSQVHYEHVELAPIQLNSRQNDQGDQVGYIRPPITTQTFVPTLF